MIYHIINSNKLVADKVNHLVSAKLEDEIICIYNEKTKKVQVFNSEIFDTLPLVMQWKQARFNKANDARCMF